MSLISRESRQNSKFFISPDPASFLHFKIEDSENHVFLVSREHGKKVEIYKDLIFNHVDIIEFINKNKFPKVPLLDSSNSRFFLENEKLVVFGVFGLSDSKVIAQEFEILADVFDSIQFVLLDGKRWKKYLERLFNIYQDDLPVIIFLDTKSGSYYLNNADGNKIGIYSGEIQTALNNLSANRLKVSIF